MMKSILILVSSFMYFPSERFEPTSRLASIVFSEKPTCFESGQPVFSKDLKATILRQSEVDNVKVLINNSVDKKMRSEIIELSEIVDFKSGTYTVVLQTQDRSETYGFTIR